MAHVWHARSYKQAVMVVTRLNTGNYSRSTVVIVALRRPGVAHEGGGKETESESAFIFLFQGNGRGHVVIAARDTRRAARRDSSHERLIACRGFNKILVDSF